MDGGPRQKLINGKPVSCRTCKFVMNPRFPYNVTSSFLRVTCCRIAPPTAFEWKNLQIEPFCGQHALDEETAPVDPRLTPLDVRERVEQATGRSIFNDETMIPMYGAPVSPEKLPPGLR